MPERALDMGCKMKKVNVNPIDGMYFKIFNCRKYKIFNSMSRCRRSGTAQRATARRAPNSVATAMGSSTSEPNITWSQSDIKSMSAQRSFICIGRYIPPSVARHAPPGWLALNPNWVRVSAVPTTKAHASGGDTLPPSPNDARLARKHNIR